MVDTPRWELLVRGRVVAQARALSALRPPPGEPWAVQPVARVETAAHLAALLPELQASGLGHLGLKGATDEALLPLDGLPGLEGLTLRSPRVGDAGLEALGGLTRLRSLDLTESGVRGPGLRALAALPALAELRLSRAPLDGATAGPALGGLRGLRVLHLGHTGLQGEDLQALGALAGLVELNLAGCRPGPGGLRFLTALGGLQALDLSGDSPLAAEDLAALSGLAALRELTLRGRHSLRGEDLAALSPLRALEELDLGGTGLVHTALRHLAGLVRLRRLSLAHCPLVDLEAAREALTRRSTHDLAARMLVGEVWQERYEFRWETQGPAFSVEELEGEGSPIPALAAEDMQAVPDALTPSQRLRRLLEGAAVYELDLDAVLPPLDGLAALAALGALRVLDLSDTPTRGRDLAGLSFAELRLLSLAGAPLGDVGLSALGPLPALKVLDLSGCGGPGLPAGLGRLDGLVGLRLGGGHLRGADLAPLIRLPELRSLSVAQSTLSGGALQPLASCGALEQLSLYRCALEGAGLAALGRCARLAELDMSRAELGPEERAALPALGRLRFLNLGYTALDDGDLPALVQLGGLEWLGLAFTRLSPAGIADLARALPGVELVAPLRPPQG